MIERTSMVNASLERYDDRALPSTRNRRVKRIALRALRGNVLCSELYALDDCTGPSRPYTVTEYSYALKRGGWGQDILLVITFGGTTDR